MAFLAPPLGFFLTPARPKTKAPPQEPASGLFEIEGGPFASLEITTAQAWLRGVTITGALTISSPGVHRLDDVLVIDGPVKVADGARLEVFRSALPSVVTGKGGARERGRILEDPDSPGPLDASDALVARDSLIGSIAAEGRVTLDGVTVLGGCSAPSIRANETILAASLTLTAPASRSCLRYSRAPEGLPDGVKVHAVTTLAPLFEPSLDCPRPADPGAVAWGRPGCGVLDPDAPAAIRRGAEDGGELGAYHHRSHAAIPSAVATKLGDLLPVGIEPVVVLDRRLRQSPPTLRA